MSVGMPQNLLLQQFGEHVYRSFGRVAYWVGSSMEKKDGWRDVDVRLLLPDQDYRAKYGDPKRPSENKAWVSTILAWSSFGRQLTGLPIDFQIQSTEAANEEFKGRPRGALFVTCDMRYADGSAVNPSSGHDAEAT
jgi:hypothetical protein